MVDNINPNKLSPLLSATERIKRVDRQSRHSQQSPFKGAQQDKQKKKKKKKRGLDETALEVTAPRDVLRSPEQTIKRHSVTKSTVEQNRKIIDIRV
jgi:hypothetical protein